jgi:hypothetical protein
MEVSSDIRWYRIKIPHKFDNSDLNSTFELPFVFIRCRLLLALLPLKTGLHTLKVDVFVSKNKNKNKIIDRYFNSQNILSVIV